ncbi:claudin-4-like [Oryzias melastigma]|uniref:claudin-4-like n=1 Tax=Oryzias melastigma TaxID=30732 RepID=UPI000CF7CBF7|nr:claudin-4-like [Oryzias melastigma]
MVSIRMQMVGCALAVIGWILVLAMYVTPMWRVTTVTVNGTTQSVWEGTFMRCLRKGGGDRSCRSYDFLVPLSPDFEGPSSVALAAVITCSAGLVIFSFTGRCAKLVFKERTMARFSVLSGVVILIAALLCFIPVCWTVDLIVRDDHAAPVGGTRKVELGACLYIGFVAVVALAAGWRFLCTSWPVNQNVWFWPISLHRTEGRETESHQLR